MLRTRAISSIGFRLAALYTALFAVSVIVLGAAVFFITQAALHDQLDTRIASETRSLMEDYGSQGFAELRQELVIRTGAPGQLDYGLIDPAGRHVAGILDMPGAANGWSVVAAPATDSPRGRERLLVTPLAHGGRLLVSDDLERIGEVSQSVLQAFAWTLALVLLFGVAGGLLLSRGLMARIDGIGRTAEAIIDGDLTRRAPVGRDDELGHLAGTINRMLDRIEALMDSLRQVSNDIAHDLRTPLTRVRQRLETALAPADEAARTAAVEQAIVESDALMATFEALLRISQVEGGARRSGFRKVDLCEIARTVVDAYAPSAEDQGAQLSLEGPEGLGGEAWIDGDRDLLVQMLANLIENALAHAGLAPTIQVRVWREGGAVQLAVRDDGPGVPEAARERVLERFYRLENSRTTPGNGLGLSLVRAVTRLHGGELWLEDATEGPVPGLCVRMSFPAG